jgi:serine/threonine protein kinase HipA of HipAB toxin-antitoxin module
MESITIRLGNSTQQLADIQAIKLCGHNMAAAALDFTKNGSQGYDQFLSSKEQFEATLDNLSKNYKYCEIIK